MLQNLSLKDLVFLDIETVPMTERYADMDEDFQTLFAAKTAYQRGEQSAETFYEERAGIWAEFGKIICISMGYFTYKDAARQFRITSFSGAEKKILEDVAALMNTYFNAPKYWFCGHNIKEFDIPYIARRMLIQGVPLPPKLQLFGKKPWEIAYLDTMDLWKFGDFKNYTSLKLLTKLLQVPCPKEDMDGSDVARVYYQEKNSAKIVAYCEKDVLAVAQLILKFRGESLLKQEEIYNT